MSRVSPRWVINWPSPMWKTVLETHFSNQIIFIERSNDQLSFIVEMLQLDHKEHKAWDGLTHVDCQITFCVEPRSLITAIFLTEHDRDSRHLTLVNVFMSWCWIRHNMRGAGDTFTDEFLLSWQIYFRPEAAEFYGRVTCQPFQIGILAFSHTYSRDRDECATFYTSWSTRMVIIREFGGIWHLCAITGMIAIKKIPEGWPGEIESY